MPFLFHPKLGSCDRCRQISSAGDSLAKAKRFHVGPGWYEIHFRTGRANDGRLYYRKRNNEDEVDVLVSIKRRQERDKNYLLRL